MPWAMLVVMKVLPWLLVGGGLIAAFSWSPLGRGILRHLRAREEESRLTRELVDELLTLRADLGEALERLDVTERRLSQLAAGSEQRPVIGPVAEPSNPGRIVTPH